MVEEIKSVKEVLTPERAEALEKTLDLLVRAKDMGLLDAANDVLEPEVLGGLAKVILSPGLLSLLDRLDEITEILARIDYDSLKENLELVNTALASVPKEAKPVGLGGLLGALRDPDVQKGLGFMIEFLRALGKKLNKK